MCTIMRPVVTDGVAYVTTWSVCWPDCKPEGPLFSPEFVCVSVCVCVSLTGTSTLQR